MSGNTTTNSISCWTIVKNIYQNKSFLNFSGTKQKKEASGQKPYFLMELEKENAKKAADEALLAKNKRVHSKWNEFKSIFGCDEKLTQKEQIDIIKLTSAKKFTSIDEPKSDFIE